MAPPQCHLRPQRQGNGRQRLLCLGRCFLGWFLCSLRKACKTLTLSVLNFGTMDDLGLASVAHVIVTSTAPPKMLTNLHLSVAHVANIVCMRCGVASQRMLLRAAKLWTFRSLRLWSSSTMLAQVPPNQSPEEGGIATAT